MYQQINMQSVCGMERIQRIHDVDFVLLKYNVNREEVILIDYPNVSLHNVSLHQLNYAISSLYSQIKPIRFTFSLPAQ